jgi:hypothetical protein
MVPAYRGTCSSRPCSRWTSGPGPSATSRRSRSSAASRTDWWRDNLKTGVDKPDLYELNRSYAELAAHYGCLVDQARALKPRDEARLERAMRYVRDNFWRGREFTSLERMQAEAARWSVDVAGRRACRPLKVAALQRCSTQPRKRHCDRCRPGRSPWATAKIGFGNPRPGRQGALLGAAVAYWQDRRRLDHRFDGAVLHRRRAGEVPPAQRAGQADRLRGLPISYVESSTMRRESGHDLAGNWKETRWASSSSRRSGPC